MTDSQRSAMELALAALARSSPFTDVHYDWKPADWPAQRGAAIEALSRELAAPGNAP